MTRLVHAAQIDALPTDARFEAGVWGVFASRGEAGATGSGRARWVLPASRAEASASNEGRYDTEATIEAASADAA